MRTKAASALVVLVVFSMLTSSCDVFFSHFPNEPPPGSDVPAGVGAAPKDSTQTPVAIGTTQSGNNSGPLKPVGFVNTGVAPATVMAWTYVPLNSENPAVPSDASTVVSPGGNPSSHLLLPLGTYTWCYHWELGDINNDMMIEYAHALNLQQVFLDETDTDDMDLAEHVNLVAPPGLGELPGRCDLSTGITLDIRPYIVESKNIDQFRIGYSQILLAHNEDFVTLAGPITVEYYFHHCDAAPCTTPLILESPVIVVIPAGKTELFYLEDTVGEHLGNWDLLIRLISIDG